MATGGQKGKGVMTNKVVSEGLDCFLYFLSECDQSESDVVGIASQVDVGAHVPTGAWHAENSPGVFFSNTKLGPTE